MWNGFNSYLQWQLQHRNKELFYINPMNFWVRKNVQHLNTSLKWDNATQFTKKSGSTYYAYVFK